MKLSQKKQKDLFLILAAGAAGVIGLYFVYKDAKVKANGLMGLANCYRNAKKYWNPETQIFEGFEKATDCEKMAITVISKENEESGKWGDPADISAAIVGHIIWTRRKANFLVKMLLTD